MKKLLLTAAALIVTLNMYGQGQGIVNFATVGVTDDKRIWVNTTDRVGDGAKAGGAAYSVALYWGPAGSTTDIGFQQVGPAGSFLNTATTTGTFNAGGRTITYQGNTAGGAVLSLQARAWLTSSGATYEEALLNPNGQVGKGRPFDVDTKDPGIPTEQPPTIGQQAGWNGFSITPVPEPSAIALGLLGAGALLMLRRRK